MIAVPMSVSVLWTSVVTPSVTSWSSASTSFVEPADDHARAVALVVPEREPLQVAEELVPQVGEDALAGPAGEVGLGCRGEQVRDPAPMKAITIHVSAFRSCSKIPSSTAYFASSGGSSAVAASRETIASVVRRRYGFVSDASVETRRTVRAHDQSSISGASRRCVGARPAARLSCAGLDSVCELPLEEPVLVDLAEDRSLYGAAPRRCRDRRSPSVQHDELVERRWWTGGGR